MIDVTDKLKTAIYGGWTETDPALASVAFMFDEYNPNDPKLQILFENEPAKPVWITRNIYRIEHNCKISIFVRPANYMPDTITTFKTTFQNIKTQIDALLTKFGVTNIYSVGLGGWRDVDFEVGRDSKGKTGKEPIVFVAEQIVVCTYYIGAFA
jgi:hypothetical protein